MEKDKSLNITNKKQETPAFFIDDYKKSVNKYNYNKKKRLNYEPT